MVAKTVEASLSGHAGWRDVAARWADVPLRLALAGIFLFHGIDKIVGGVSGFADMMDLTVATAWSVVLAELGAGTLILVGMLPGALAGLATRLAGLLVLPVMVGAIAKLHWPRWHFAPADGFPMGGMQFQVAIILVGLWFLVRGGSRQEAGATPDGKAGVSA